MGARSATAALAALALLHPGVRAQVPESAAAGLKIVILAGDDAVNVVSQRTAVPPIVEVRDRNDHPVAGAVVVFRSDGHVTFANGARSVTLTTNANGRVTVASESPARTGNSQIEVRASFEGRSVSSIIRQTNVQTAAQAQAI